MGDDEAVDTSATVVVPPTPSPQNPQPEKPADDDTVLEDNNESPPKEPEGEATTTMGKETNTTTTTTTTSSMRKLINLRFLFANRDGLSVSIHCDPMDTVGQVKGALISLWPKELPACSDGDDLRLICMGKGFLTPDDMTLEELEIPSFKTHATPINVSVKRSPESTMVSKQHQNPKLNATSSNAIQSSTAASAQGCGCVIQ